MSIADSYERYMLTLINAERAAVGLDPVQLELNLNLAAEQHTLWMIETQIFSHQGAANSQPSERMAAAGFDFVPTWYSGENIAAQSERGAPGIMDDVYDLHISLMNSPLHRANILSANFDYVGIGIEIGDFTYQSGVYNSVIVTQTFAATAGTADLDIGEQRGTSGADTLLGTEAADVMRALAGNDTLRGLGGDDTLRANDGADRLFGGTGDDTLEAGRGNDVANGETGDDLINGGWGHDKLYGAAGNDILIGNRGDDLLSGGNGADELRAGAGRDWLEGGRGNDVLTGGSGVDTFVFLRGGESDRVQDFTDGVDTLDLTSWGFASVEAALGAAGQVGAHVVFAFGGGDMLTVEHTTLAALTADLLV